MKNKIIGIGFSRDGIERHRIILILDGKIPSLGYGPKEIRKMLKRFKHTPY